MHTGHALIRHTRTAIDAVSGCTYTHQRLLLTSLLSLLLNATVLYHPTGPMASDTHTSPVHTSFRLNQATFLACKRLEYMF